MSFRPTQSWLAGLTHPRRRPGAAKKSRKHLRFQAIPKVIHNNERRKPKTKLVVENFNWAKPGFFKSAFLDIPARTRWFVPQDTAFRYPSDVNVKYLEPYGDAIVPLELTRSVVGDGDGDGDENSTTQTFERLEAPLYLLLQHMAATEPSDTQLYLAQHSLADLPAPLQKDLPMPTGFLDALAAKGDIYGSSLWMGKSPTVTPLHRDPNPNFFVQLAGKKVIRLINPNLGDELYGRVQIQLGGMRRRGAKMRGEEMMQGTEKEILEEAVWGKEQNLPIMHGISGLEVILRPGDAFYIPVGWWHAVRGEGKGANASVNWWFR